MAQALNGRVGITTRSNRDYLEIVQGEEKEILFIVDGLFDKDTFDSIIAKFGDSKGTVIVKDEGDNDEPITRLCEFDDIQVFRCILAPVDTSSLAPEVIKIEIDFDDQRLIMTHGIRILESIVEET